MKAFYLCLHNEPPLCLLYLYTLVKASHNEANERCKRL